MQWRKTEVPPKFPKGPSTGSDEINQGPSGLWSVNYTTISKDQLANQLAVELERVS